MSFLGLFRKKPECNHYFRTLHTYACGPYEDLEERDMGGAPIGEIQIRRAHFKRRCTKCALIEVVIGDQWRPKT
jgi:hypothetical protein